MATSRRDHDLLEQALARLAQAEATAVQAAQPSNIAAIVNSAPTNNQGTGGTIVAVLSLPSLYTGIFKWTVKAQATTVAADVSTWTVTSQRGAGPAAAGVAPTYTGAAVLTPGTVGAGSVGFIATPGGFAAAAGSSALSATTAISTGMAGTGIAITAGGGGSKTQDTSARTIGAGATLQDYYSASGMMIDQAAPDLILGTNLNQYRSAASFALNFNVFLILTYTNSAANRAVSGITMTLEEVRF